MAGLIGGVPIRIKMRRKKESIDSIEEDEETQNIAPQPDSETESEEEIKQNQDLEGIRTVIKVDNTEASNEKGEEEKEKIPTETPTAEPKKTTTTDNKDSSGIDTTDDSKDKLEQRREMLQTIKDFDFQIKKNQENIEQLNEKIDGVTKDLDDLVSLYEIVSEQMNPFVGLSNVTKKRLDALENFIEEVEALKKRIEELESEPIQKSSSIKGGRKEKPVQTPSNAKTEPSTPTTETPPVEQNLSTKELDAILNTSYESILLEQKIDTTLDEFLQQLK